MTDGATILDRMITDAKIRAKAKEAKRKPEWHPSPYTLALQEQEALEAETPRRASVVDRAKPRALLLITTETVCLGCGSRHRSPNRPMADYGPTARSILHTQDDILRLERWAGKLPRELSTTTAYAPACEACF
jgi:hypothetical protein